MKQTRNVRNNRLLSFSISRGVTAPLPVKVKGCFELDGEVFLFRFEDTPSLNLADLCCLEDAASRKLRPLLQFLVDRKCTVTLTGMQMGSCYTVTNMVTESHLRFSEAFVPTVAAALRDKCVKGPVTEEGLRSRDEIEAYFNLCGHLLPDWVASAVKRNIPAASGNSDNSKHALTAMRYLVNIDWSAPEWNVPQTTVVRAKLDKAFYGMQEVKQRILEVLAQIRRTGQIPRWGILLNGPAGCGKTSIAKAFAAALDMPTISIDISSISKDSDTLAGSSRIFSNGRPGIIWDKLLEAHRSSGVLLVNEIDKSTTDGGRSSTDILLTLLDNQGFLDNFMEVPLPTEGLFCIATCNNLERVNKVLRDRFLVIDVPGFSPMEKEQIWKNFVLPKAMKRLQISRSNLSFTEEAVQTLVRSYATAPGVRDLEQYAERFVGVYCLEADEHGKDYRRTFTEEDLIPILGPAKAYTRCIAPMPGMVNSVYCADGMATHFLVEATCVPGIGNLTILGPLSQRQKDYIQVAYEYLRSSTFPALENKDVTVFVPVALPDNGNYIGCAAYMAICTNLQNICLDATTAAVLGGVDLHGNLYFEHPDVESVLKALSAAGIDTVYAPMGTGARIPPVLGDRYNITIYETINAAGLLAMAINGSSMDSR